MPHAVQPKASLSTRPRIVAIAFAAIVALAANRAHGVERSCGASPTTNTSTVLCASPSGPCNGTSVTVGAPIDVVSGGCVFDLGGRALIFDRTFEMVATGLIKVINAGNVTITDTGALKSRGDYVTNPTGRGGTIILNAAGIVLVEGNIDVGGDPAGSIDILATGNVTLDNGSTVRGLGSSNNDTADGGTLTIVSTGGSIVVNGSVMMNGESDGQGGDVVLQAARDVDVDTAMQATGGEAGGGWIDISAGDDIQVGKNLEADSRGGGGDGGELSLAAGEDSLGGVVPGGTLTIDDATMELAGSTGDSFGGDGGAFSASTRGNLLIGADATVRVNAGTSLDGSGGSVSLASGDEDLDSVGSLDGDLTVYGTLLARSGATGGIGGDLTLLAGRDLMLDAVTDLGGEYAGGWVTAEAGRTFTLASAVQAEATASGGSGGVFNAKACDLTVASAAGILAPGEWGGLVQLTGRHQLTVNANSDIDASGWWGSIRLITRTNGTCNNAANRPCLSNADCVVGCSTGVCVNVNPNTGGTTAQFDPPPEYVLNTELAPCP